LWRIFVINDNKLTFQPQLNPVERRTVEQSSETTTRYNFNEEFDLVPKKSNVNRGNKYQPVISLSADDHVFTAHRVTPHEERRASTSIATTAETHDRITRQNEFTVNDDQRNGV